MNRNDLVNSAVVHLSKINSSSSSSFLKPKPKAGKKKNKPKTEEAPKPQPAASQSCSSRSFIPVNLTVGLVSEVEVVAPLVEESPPRVSIEGSTPLPLPLPNILVGGRLAHFAQSWANITDDKSVLSLIKRGYIIPFKEKPILYQDPIFLQQPLSQLLEKEVANLLSKGAMEEINQECPGFYSRIFLIPKKNGTLRLIIDLSALNHFVDTQTFKMETQRKVRNAISCLNDWAFSLDLTDAYLNVLIHPWSSLRFTLRDRVYEFKVLPYSLSTSPLMFTLLMSVIATFLRKRVITLHPYLDDWLSRNQNR